MITPCNATEDLLKRYTPPSGLHDAKSVIMGINIIKNRGRNKCLSDTEMAHITNDETMQLAFMKRVFIFQKILNFIELAMFIVPVDSQIQRIKDNYTNMKDLSQINLDRLKGASGEKANANPSFEQQPHSGKTQSHYNKNHSGKRANRLLVNLLVICSKCQNKGHYAENCKSVYTKDGKYIGEGEPPPRHYWTKRNAKEAFGKEVLKQQKRKKTVQA
jgi:hypothetical protein